MKRLLLLFLLVPLLVFSQRTRSVIDSIHTKRLCVEYPGLTEIPTVIEEFHKSEYVFTGKVVEIIRKETMEATDFGDNGPMHFRPVQNYWYVLEVSEQFKGKPQKKIKVFSRMFSSMSPLLMLDKEYLIYAKLLPDNEKRFFDKSKYLFFYCDAISTHLKFAEEDLKILRKLKTN